MSRSYISSLRIAGLLALMVWGNLSNAWAQGPLRGVRRFTVTHRSPEYVALELQRLVSQQQWSAEIFLDRRDGSLVVEAAPNLQAALTEAIRQIDLPATPSSTVQLTAAWQDVPAANQVLTHLSPREFEQELLAIWPRLRFEAEGTGDARSARLPGEERAVLRIDSRTRTVALSGPADIVATWRKVVAALDAPLDPEQQAQLLPLDQADPTLVARTVKLLGNGQPAGAGQPRPVALQVQPNVAPEGALQPAAEPAAAGDEESPIGPVTIEILEGLDVIILRGKKRDVERVRRIIADIERQSAETSPEIEVYPLQHIDNRAVAELMAQFYEQAFATRQSRVTITPLIKPNALLLIGSKASMAPIKDLLAKLDQPVSPQSQLRVFPLKHLAATDAETTVRNFFVQRPGEGTDERTGLGTRVNVVAETRINALIVQASPRDLAEVALLLQKLDVDKSAATQEVRVFRLRNALAEELAPVLQEAISGQRTTGGGGGNNANNNASAASRASANLQLLQLDSQGRRTLESGILANVKVTADPRGNALLVTGSPESLGLVAALIEQLDSLPAAEASIKVFTLVNGDAQTIVTALQQLFGQSSTGGQNQAIQQTVTGGGDTSLVPLRFTVEQRTNSVIASGSRGDLEVVERLLIRLDEEDVRRRRTTVYRLRNAPAVDVATSINQFLSSQRQVNQLAPTLVSQTEQIEREVVVVAERVSNSLLVSATPQYYEEIQKIVEDLDQRPPMVMIQVLIAEVTLDDLNEFGVELGLQDSLLFDRGIGAGATNAVGFPFNNQPLGNVNDATSLATRNAVGTQGLSHFTLGRSNSTLGYGGLVLSASSDSVNILLRALQRSQRLQVVSRPQVQTLDNQPAFVQVGARVPRITNSTPNQFGQVTNSTELINVGILLGVTPRTSPDGLIVMEINAEKSEVGPEATGIPIFVNENGDVIRSPQIFITTAQTTVSARNGQTVILGGLITKNRTQETRRVPYLGDIPVLGRLFRHDLQTERKTELLIIMTPYVVRSDEDVELLNARETERMNWCLSDIVDVHGSIPGGSGSPVWNEKATPVIFPDEDPAAASAAGATGQNNASPNTPNALPPERRRADPPFEQEAPPIPMSALPPGASNPAVTPPGPMEFRFEPPPVQVDPYPPPGVNAIPQ